MSLVMWQDKFATGIKEIDNDHKSLFDLIGQFYDAYASGKGAEKLDPVFDELMAYSEYHFKREEELLEKIGFPGLDEHKESHKFIKKKVIELYRRYKAGERTETGSELCLEIMAFLNNWLHFHIIEEDMKYRDFMISQGEL